MPLNSLLQNLNSFNYYADKANSGVSGQPYIKHPSYAHDPTGISDAVTHTVTDVVRMTKFLVDVPQGPLFLAKQMGLQMMNPELHPSKGDFKTDRKQTGQGLIRNVGNTIANTGAKIQNQLGSNRIFSPLNFMAQIAGSAAGKHIPRHGLSLQVSDSDKTWYIVNQVAISDRGQTTASKMADRSVGFLRNLSRSDPGSTYGAKDGAEQKRELYSYTGGPGSYLGLGKTVINKYYSTFAASNISDPNTKIALNGFVPIPHSKLIDMTPEEVKGFRNQDFRAYKASIDSDYKKKLQDRKIRISDYSKYDTSKRIGVINPNPSNGTTNPHDTINMVSLYYAGAASEKTKDINGEDVSPQVIRDLVKFRIKAIDNDKPGFGVYMIFRAFFDGISDTIDAQWNPIKYSGRGESFYGYEGFTSGYNINFTIVAFSRDEMRPLYQKINYLKSTLAPDYKNNKMRGNMVEMTIGDYLKYQPGIITSISTTVPEDAPWEIALTEPDAGGDSSDKQMHELPQMLKISLTFTPIYNFLPRKGADVPFIGIDDREEGEKSVKSDKNWMAKIPK